MNPRWNFSSRARELSGGDAIVISIPKSGRTWLRTFLAAYFCKRAGREFALESEYSPRIVYSHDRFEQRTKADLWDRVRGKYLIPPSALARAKIVLLARDPRDAFVSLFVQLTRRTRETPDEVKQKTVSELLRDSAFGMRAMIEIMNNWLGEFSARKDFHLARYESLRVEPEENFRALLSAIDDSPFDPNAFEHALQFSEFRNMKKMEAGGAFDSKILKAGDIRDSESFKVRRGEIGGHREYFSTSDLEYSALEMTKLDPAFGYQIAS